MTDPLPPERLEALRSRLKARKADREHRKGAHPGGLKADLPDGWPDTARFWCRFCGLADAPCGESIYDPDPPCPRCGREDRWYGRVSDLNGTATAPPEDECPRCYQWRGSHLHGWAWFRVCSDCDCAHHRDEIWMA